MYTCGGGRRVLHLSNKQNSTKEFIFNPSHKKLIWKLFQLGNEKIVCFHSLNQNISFLHRYHEDES